MAGIGRVAVEVFGHVNGRFPGQVARSRLSACHPEQIVTKII